MSHRKGKEKRKKNKSREAKKSANKERENENNGRCALRDHLRFAAPPRCTHQWSL